MMHTIQVTQTEKPIDASHRASDGRSLPDKTGFSGLLASMFSVQTAPETVSKGAPEAIPQVALTTSAENSNVLFSPSEPALMEEALPLEFVDHADGALRFDAALLSENSITVKEVMAQISSLQRVPENLGYTVSEVVPIEGGASESDVLGVDTLSSNLLVEVGMTSKTSSVDASKIDTPDLAPFTRDNLATNLATLETSSQSLGVNEKQSNSLEFQNVTELNDERGLNETAASSSFVTNSMEKNGNYSEVSVKTEIDTPTVLADSEVELDDSHSNILLSPLPDKALSSGLDDSFDMNGLETKPLTQPVGMSSEPLDPISTENDINHNIDATLAEQSVEVTSSVAQALAAHSSSSQAAGNQAAVQFNQASANSGNQGGGQGANQGMTHWGSQNTEGQMTQTAGQQGQSFGQSGQNSSGQQTQQHAMMFAQANQENRQQSMEQQAALKAINDAMAKPEGKELLAGAEIASSERKGALPLGLQAINQPVRHPQWGQALGQRVVFMANNNLQQAQITLNPQNLGQIQVTLQLDKDQQMHVSLTAQNGTTRESMENALPRLREMMEQAGVNLGSVDVREQKQFSDNASNHSNDDTRSSDTHLLEDSSLEESPLETVISTDNIVDYYA